MRFSFFATPSTLEKLNAREPEKVLLIGSFTGNWNFGDLLQQRGSIRWHQARRAGAVIAPLHDLGRVRNAEHLQRLQSFFGVEDFIHFTWEPGAAAVQRARELGLVPVLAESLQGASSVHVYGGGFFNRFWGPFMVGLIESVLRTWLPGHYVISGQQVSPDFAPELVAHAQQWQPALVGCRDPLSLKHLKDHGLEARLSGDDALEELVRAAGEASRAGPRTPEKGRFALHMNVSSYTHSENDGPAELPPEVSEQMNAQLRLLREHLGERAAPVVLNAFIDERPTVEDSLASVKKTEFAALFPHAELIDLVGLLLQGQLHRGFEQVRRCELLVTSSYHLTILSRVAGVPVFLGAFNDYYRQKREGLGQPAGTLEQFLASDWSQVEAESAAYTASQEELRREWHAALDQVLSRPPSGASHMARAAHVVERARSGFEARLRELEQETRAAREAADTARGRYDTQAARLEELEEALRTREARVQELQARQARLEQEKQALQARHDAQEATLQRQATQHTELQARLDALLAQEAPLRHRLVDGLNDQLKRASGGRAHDALRRVVDATVRRRK
jgi:polysaccharide pyruvyl transferase WcaK-like protein